MGGSKILKLWPVVMGKKKVPWYLSGGVAAANCIAAYKAIGAASLAASYINLANPGTYDLTAPTAAPTFDTTTGWTFNGSTQYLTTGITPGNAQVWSMIFRFSGVPGAGGYAIGYYAADANGFMMSPWRGTNRLYWNGASNLPIASPVTNGVMAIAGATGYYNGASDGTMTLAAATEEAIYIGANNGQSPPTPHTYFTGVIEAVALYDAVLTTPQVLAISNAMAALPFDVTTPVYPGPTPSESGEFMVAFASDWHMNDTQGITTAQAATITAYLKNLASYLGLSAVLYGGDYNNVYAVSGEGAAFVSAMGNLADIPHLLAIGNHDYTADVRGSTIFNEDFPQSYYTGKSWWSGGFYDASNSENAYLLLTIDAVDYIFITLEWFPRAAALAWVDGLLTTHAAKTAIIVTHSYEYSDGSVYTIGDNYGPDAYTEITDADYSWGTDMWNMIKTHDNVILVCSGHINTAAYHSAASDGGQAVNQVLFDLQGDTGFERTSIRFMRINPTAGMIKVETFSPVTSAKITDASMQFTLYFEA